MPKCDTCGNDYPNALQVTLEGKTHTFDCFECAIEMLAPACAALRLLYYRAWRGAGRGYFLLRPLRPPDFDGYTCQLTHNFKRNAAH